MPTYLFTKKEFMEYVDSGIKEDQIVVMTNELCGSLTFSKKKGTILPHQFASDSLKDEGLGHIMKGQSKQFGLLIVDKERLSESSIEKLKQPL